MNPLDLANELEEGATKAEPHSVLAQRAKNAAKVIRDLHKEVRELEASFEMALSSIRAQGKLIITLQGIHKNLHKNLTDDEIVKVWDNFVRDDNPPFINFAREVLRRAQEK